MSASGTIPADAPDLAVVIFPALVKNEDKALECIGGREKVSDILLGSNSRLALRWRPQDPYSKPMFAVSKDSSCGTPGLIFRARVKKQSRKISSMEMVGVVSELWKFDQMSDHQLLPMTYRGEISVTSEQKIKGKQGSISEEGTAFTPESAQSKYQEISSLRLQCVQNGGTNRMQGANKDTFSDLMAPPIHFARSGHPSALNYKKSIETVDGATASSSMTESKKKAMFQIQPRRERALMKQKRRMRMEEPVPQPGDLEETMAKLPSTKKPFYSELYQLFQDQPLIPLTVLKSTLGEIHADHAIKSMLPNIAYYISHGPWRACHCRLGYDPYTDPAARQYQMLDVRPTHSQRVKRATSAYLSRLYARHGPQHRTVSVKKRISVGSRSPRMSAQSTAQLESDLPSYHFVAGRLPEFMNCLYRLCDVHLPRVEAVLKRAESNWKEGDQCDIKYGWITRVGLEACRSAVYQSVDDTVAAQTGSPI